MRVLDFSSASVARPSALPPRTAACIGSFDGLHLGHQGLIARARSLAAAEEVAVVTFEPRPVEVLAPERAAPRLQSPAQRERVCRQLGVDTLAILPFDEEVSRMSPVEFVEGFLIGGLSPAQVVVGYDFHFGAGRAGGPADLARLLAPAGIEVSVVDKIATPPGADEGAISIHEGDKLGSTIIRELVRAGELERAADMLGRLYALAGPVVHGAARGRELGFPTANILSTELHPAEGVYACFLSLLGERPELGRGVVDELECWPAVANIGTNPTFGAGRPRSLEVHAIDVALGERLYGREVEVSFVARLRDERRFADAQQLRAAIAADMPSAP